LGYTDDVNFWLRWSEQIFNSGLGNAYDAPDNNYNPLYQYILWLYSMLAGSVEKIQRYHSFLKAFTLAFDFAGAIVAASLVKDKKDKFLYSLFLLFNVGYLYNTVVWEQVDAIYTCLSFVAVYLAIRQHNVWSVLFFVLALNAKLQAIIFFPMLALLWLPAWMKSIRTVGVTVVATLLLQTLILAPFIWGGYKSYLDTIIDINFRSVGFYPFVTVNAYNMWAVAFDGGLTWTSNAGLFWGKTYKFWGTLLFLVMSFVTLAPLFVNVVYGELKKNYLYKENISLILLTCGMIPLVFCFFNTEMHERYWHSAILFLGAYSFVSSRYSVFVLVSSAYFLNLESILRYLNLANYSTLIFDYRFVAALFGVAIAIGIREIYYHAKLGAILPEIMAFRKVQPKTSLKEAVAE